MELQRASPPVLSNAHAQAEITLPDLKTVLSPDFQELSSSLRLSRQVHDSPVSVRSLPRIDPGPAFVNGTSKSSESGASPSDAGSVMSIDDQAARPTSVSMDDPDVRIAAEALSGLGNPDFARSPSTRTFSHASLGHVKQEPEPLFELFTRAHPWVGGTINGSLSAYSTTKTYSPRVIQYGADLVERSITTPVVSTVSKVGRMTGVESGLRWYYGGANASRPNDVDGGSVETASKRRRLMDDEMDVEYGHFSPPQSRLRLDSNDINDEVLPAYRASKPPSYREKASPTEGDGQMQLERPSHNRSWSSQVFVTTSGLGVALSVTSRRSLRFCLSFLSRQADHVTTVMNALKLVLEQYDQARDAWHQNHDASIEAGLRPKTPDHDEAARRLAQIIKTHSEDIWRTLENVVTSVSSYAGGALPENARHFVRNQLMSLPQRWRVVSDNQTGESETSRSAHRMIAFATEGLDMMGQVSQTMKLTLESAERWLARAGRRQEMVETPHRYDTKDYDMHMDGTNQSIPDVEKQ